MAAYQKQSQRPNLAIEDCEWDILEWGQWDEEVDGWAWRLDECDEEQWEAAKRWTCTWKDLEDEVRLEDTGVQEKALRDESILADSPNYAHLKRWPGKD